MKQVPIEILDVVNKTIKTYKLFPQKDIIVAFSGGKDSLFLSIVLRELGFNVIPIICDVGYNIDWERAKYNAKMFHFKLQILDLIFVKNIPSALKEIENNYREIQEISCGKHKGLTVCTPCYNSKIILLREWCRINSNIQQIAFGHHGADTISSFLKSYFMYIDRWIYQHTNYNDVNFENLIKLLKPTFCGDKDTLLNSSEWTSIIKLMSEGLIGTDEPIRKKITDTDYEIIRPMYHILEYDIVRYYDGIDIEFQERECSVSGLRNFSKKTPREMIHHMLLDNMPRENIELLLTTILKSLDEFGNSIVDVRNNRASILGAEYKSGNFNSLKL